MAESLPTTEGDMKKVPHVTNANYEKFGKELLEVLRKYAAEKALVELDMDSMPEIDESFSDNDATNWSSLGASGTSSSGTNSRKRKRGFGGNFRRKKTAAKKSASPKKRRTATKTTAKKATTTTNRAGNKFTLLKPRVFNP